MTRIRNLSNSSAPQNDNGRRIRVPNLQKDRLGTLAFLSWWDREVVQNARVLVVGAGALGNEVLKNLALKGIGNIYIVDMDEIEMANLSRSILFRDTDSGEAKVHVAARQVREINPDINVYPLEGRLTQVVGAGLIRQMDVVIGCLDNREARDDINRLCYRVRTPWIEGALGGGGLGGGLEAMTVVFDPNSDAACYHCTLSEAQQKRMKQRRSCKFFAQRDFTHGKVPTTSIAASIAGAMQVQEAFKILHGKPVYPGKEFRFNGNFNEIFAHQLPRNEHCEHHYHWPDDAIYEIEGGYASEMTGKQLMRHIEATLGEPGTVMLGFDLIVRGRCEVCGTQRDIMKPLDLLTEQDYHCEHCGAQDSLFIDEMEDTTNVLTGDEFFANLPLGALGVPPLHILECITFSGNVVAFELTGDRQLYGL